MLYSQRNESIAVISVNRDGALARLATGFFLSTTDDFYLVTCHHVMLQAQRACDQLEQAELFLNIGSNFRDLRVPLFDFDRERKWRSFLDPGRYWDVAVIKLDRHDVVDVNIEPWNKDQVFPSNAALPAESDVFVVTYQQGTQPNPAAYDVPSKIDSDEHQIHASDRGAIIDNPLYPGASGSPICRVVDELTDHETDRERDSYRRIQLVGIFTGALPPGDPKVGHFHYIDTATQIMEAKRDCLNDEGSSFRDY